MLVARLHEREIRRIIGLADEGARVVDGVGTLEACEDRCLYFVNSHLAEPRRAALAELRGCIVIARQGSGLADLPGDCVILEALDPRAAIGKVLAFIRDQRLLQPLVATRRISRSADVSPLAVLEGAVEVGAGAVVEPFCVIGSDVRIGHGSIVRSGVRIFPRTIIGDESVIGANSVIGHPGYGFVRGDNGYKERIPQLGGVSIGAHVEIGALVSIPSGTIAPTIVEDHAKIDDHVLVAHNAHVGINASIVGGVIVGGHAVIGPEAWVGMNASIRDGRRVGAHALVGMGASVQEDLPDDQIARAPRPSIEPRRDPDRSGIGFARNKK